MTAPRSKKARTCASSGMEARRCSQEGSVVFGALSIIVRYVSRASRDTGSTAQLALGLEPVRLRIARQAEVPPAFPDEISAHGDVFGGG